MNFITRVLSVGSFALLCFSPFSFAAETPDDQSWQIRGRSETTLEWKEVIGRSGSGIDEGTAWRQELSINLKKKLEKGKAGLDLRARATNDEQVDNRDARLMYLHGYWQQEKMLLEVGDVAGSFNPLVLSASAKGAKINLRTGERDQGWDHTVLAGIQKASWEEVYDSSSDESVDRYVAGFNSIWTHAPAQSIAAAGSFIKDDSSSVKDTSLGLDLAEAKTAGVEWKWRFNRYFSLKGETAFSHADADTSDDQSGDDGTAIRFKILTKPIPRAVRSNFMYERLDTDFKPVIASASSDRERIENDTEWMINRQLKLRMTLKYSRDNLDGALGDTLHTRDGILYYTYRPDWLKRSDFGLRTQFKRNSGRGTDQHMQIVAADFNFRPKSGWRYGASWIFTHINDDAVGAEDQRINTLRGTLGWKKRLANDHMIRATVRLDGHFINKDSGDQEALGGKVDFGYDAGNLWSTDLSASTKNSDNDAAADNTYISYQLRANYHPGEDRSKAIRLTAERREYETDDATADDYQEHLVKLSYLFSF